MIILTEPGKIPLSAPVLRLPVPCLQGSVRGTVSDSQVPDGRVRNAGHQI